MTKQIPPTQYSLTILSRDAHVYATLFTQLLAADPTIPVTLDCVACDPHAINSAQAKGTHILLADPNIASQVIASMPNLQWCQSTWAGNAPLLTHPKQDYMLTGVKGIFSQLMSEYVLSYILAYIRQHDAFAQLQTQSQWHPPTLTSMTEYTIGIMGMGNIAQGMLPVFDALQANVIGLSHSGKTLTSHPHLTMYSSEYKAEFLTHCDVLVNLLPETKQTQGFITHTDLMSRHAQRPSNSRGLLFVNAGRGSVISDECVYRSLQEGLLDQAVLDVFSQEPLPSDSPLWTHPQVKITQHTAAISTPERVMSVVSDNLTLFINHRPLNFTLDPITGY